jgi:hypothetical protein
MFIPILHVVTAEVNHENEKMVKILYYNYVKWWQITRERKELNDGENCITRALINFNLHQILLVWSNTEAWDGHDM